MSNKFEFNNNNLALLQSKSKLYSFISGKLDKAYFKLSNGEFVFALSSSEGIITTTLNIDYQGDTRYFSVDYLKWTIALQKFAGVDTLKFSLSNSLLKIYIDGSNDVINLGIVEYEANSQIAKQIDEFIPQRKNEIKDANHKIVLTHEILNDFELVNNLFTSNGRVNAIGIGKDEIIYSDRAVVLKAKLSTPLDDEAFANLPEDDDHIYIHTFVLKLFSFLNEFSNEVYFDNDYEVLYWEDGNTELVIYSDSINVNIPTEEQFEGICPSNKDVYIETSIATLRESLNFFNGFYDSSNFKPIKFNLAEGEEVILSYKHPTAEITKTVENVVSNFNGTFNLDAETLKKIIQKIGDIVGGDSLVRFNFDDDTVSEDEASAGVYCTVGDRYRCVIAKLLDE